MFLFALVERRFLRVSIGSLLLLSICLLFSSATSIVVRSLPRLEFFYPESGGLARERRIAMVEVLW